MGSDSVSLTVAPNHLSSNEHLTITPNHQKLTRCEPHVKELHEATRHKLNSSRIGTPVPVKSQIHGSYLDLTADSRFELH